MIFMGVQAREKVGVQASENRGVQASGRPVLQVSNCSIGFAGCYKGLIVEGLCI
jgi:hypothetical protein